MLRKFIEKRQRANVLASPKTVSLNCSLSHALHIFIIIFKLVDRCYTWDTMFRSQLMRAGRTASQKLSQPSSIQERQIIASSFSSLSSQTLRSQTPRICQHLTRRWQSTEPAKSESASNETTKPPESSSEDALKQEIEKKNKEIIDLKVRDSHV